MTSADDLADDVRHIAAYEADPRKEERLYEAADRIATLSAENARLKAQVAERDEALRFVPKPSKTFAYQASGYAEGWHEAIRQYRSNNTAALQPKAEARHD